MRLRGTVGSAQAGMKPIKYSADCPECGGTVSFKAAPRIGQPTACPGCRRPLEVVHLRPLELEAAGAAEPPRGDRKRDRTPSKKERRRFSADFE